MLAIPPINFDGRHIKTTGQQQQASGMRINKTRDIYTAQLDDADIVNPALIDGFLAHREDDATRRSHFFNGRHENIYIDDDVIPQISRIKQAVCEGVAQITGRPANELKAGLWFNAMEPGHVTLPHRHDDDDEICSAVYYVDVPEHSGKLVLTQPQMSTTVTPRAGMFVFFPPDMVHEVTRNDSDHMRLSLGINVGPRHRED